MNVPSEFATSKVKSQWSKALRVISVALVGLFAQGSLAQTTTTLNFDSLPDGTVVTNQYSAQGVTASGVTIINAASIGLSSHSSPNIAFAPFGLMTFSVSIPNVKTVSTYITGPADIGVYAYDANDNLVGSQVSAGVVNSVLFTVTSSGAPITKVAIHDGGATFFIDDLSFTTAPTVPACRAAAEAAYNLIAALPESAYIRAKTWKLDRIRLLAEVVAFEAVRAKGKATQKALTTALVVIQTDVKLSVKSPQNQPIINKLSEISTLIKNNACQ